MRILGLLQEEGVLTRERLYLGSGNFDEGVRIVFQAFADFLLLKRRLALSDDPLNDQAVKSWLAEECSRGINEAATILFPEVYGVEVPDLQGIKLAAAPKRHEDRDAWDRHHRARQLYRSLVETLPYRDSQAISQRTIDLLNDAQPYLSRDEFYRVLFTLAPQPGNRLNGNGLHRYLLRQRMPQRDSDFGFATYHELFETFSPAARLARWAAAGPYPAYDAEVIELACIPLCWLLSSPNRFMRDWVTKALVQLLRGHLDVMRALFERFWNVDDPYVVQRVVAIAYGSLLRSTPAQAEQAKALAEVVHARVFTRPVRADELLLDAARGIVRWAVAHRLLPGTALDSSRRPYGLKPPGPPPTKATIEAKYGWHKDQPDDESYSSISFSLLSTGDFGRYVVESGLYHFSRYRIGQEYPKHEYRKPRFVKSRWKKFVASLSDDQKNAMTDWLRNPEERSMGRLSFLSRREDDPLSDEQRELTETTTGHTLACLYAADRYHHLEAEVRPNLEAGHVVLSDRYIPVWPGDAALDGIDPVFLWRLNAEADRPDLAVILEADPGVISERLQERGPHNRFQLSPGSSHAEAHFYRQATERLIQAGFDVLRVDVNRQPPEQSAELIRDRLLTFFAPAAG